MPEVPLISIVMSTYNPNLDWLREQLDSLNAQDYPNLELIVRDDASADVAWEDIAACIRACVTAFPCVLERGKENLGSNESYSLLVLRAQGMYTAFCDQDDIWLPHKLSVLQAAMAREDAVLACSDMAVIAANGHELAAGLHTLRKRVVYRSGDNVAPSLLFANFASGCAAMLRTDIAKAALPCIDHIVYDHWFALYAAAQGRVICVPDLLIRHRVHSANQTNTVADVSTKQDYVERRILPYARRMQEMHDRLSLGQVQRDTEAWAAARAAYAQGDKSQWRLLWRHRKLDSKVSLFELLLPIMPTWGFRLALRLIRQGRI